MNYHKSKTIVVREYAQLFRGGEFKEIDRASITPAAFDWLLVNGQSTSQSNRELVRVKRFGNEVVLQLVNFVGVLDTPCGTRIEILPKISNAVESQQQLRKTLLKMLATVEKLSWEQFHESQLETINKPLIEVLISQFLNEVTLLIKKGIKSNYLRVNQELPFLKGQLQVVKQIRQRPGKEHHFNVSFDLYSPNRAENRLIHSSLLQVSKWVKSTSNQRLIKELLFVFSDIEKSSNYFYDFKKWSNDRSLVHYRTLKPWCELILKIQSPFTLSGKYSGISFLFPMEVLFERYVANKLARQLPTFLKLKEQVRSQYLTEHQTQSWFNLKPDIVIKNKEAIVSVLDTKWKIINELKNNNKDKYDLSQSDMYQLFAYGDKYLSGVGNMYLIFPKNEQFNKPLDYFEFKPGLKLHVVPYDLVTDECKIDLSALSIH